MKKITLLLLLICFGFSINAQSSRNDKEWFASVGLNAINNLGSQSPVESPFDWANGLPISAAIELGWTSGLAIEQSFTLNQFAKGDEIEGITLSESLTYSSFDTHVKYYFGKHLFPKSTWIDFYGNAGLGIFSMDETNISLNVGGGVLFWLNRRETLGVRLQMIGKFAMNNSDVVIDSNHYQTHIQMVFAL